MDALQVWKYSKISQHEEIARGSLSLAAWQHHGEQSWDQRVALRPARTGRGSAWGGEVLLKLKYTTIEVGLYNMQQRYKLLVVLQPQLSF